MVVLDNIGEKIKCERLKKSLKQYELAEKAGISNTYLSDIELGRTIPSLKTLNRIAKVLKLDVKNLL
ncbi:helix-turn-helix domain-containing protein [Clostridium drakei]|uniref:helix-turn-helix domain-containing protein n=1 Tax=Clostridium drakei TaxID=332101 RepID=UPI001FA75A66|nr:helix-turn-helix transcriptional regulator [Clostridium drakei]